MIGVARGVTTPSCPICASQATRIRGPQRKWPYHKCRGCGHIFLFPSPGHEELARHYNSAYSVPRAEYERQVKREFPRLRRVIAELGVTPGAMLEIGCSYGSMLCRFRDLGWETVGIEWDARATLVAREENNLAVYTGAVEEIAPTMERSFDIVLGSHVVEHARDPRCLVSSLAKITRPGSVLVLRTPNSRSLAARFCSGWWQWAVAPEHVHLFSAESLTRLLASEGFSVTQHDYRRGDANSTLFELIHSAGKVLLGNTDEGRTEKLSKTGPRPLSSGPLFGFIRSVLNSVGGLFDWAAQTAPLPLRAGLPELLVLAKRN